MMDFLSLKSFSSRSPPSAQESRNSLHRFRKVQVTMAIFRPFLPSPVSLKDHYGLHVPDDPDGPGEVNC